MTPLNKEQKQNIIERINFMQVELKDLEDKYLNITWEEYSTNREKRRNVERIIENLANAIIDVCKIYLAGETIEVPATYQDVIFKMGELNIVSSELSQKLAQLAKARNVLAHQYLDLKWDMIKNILQFAPLTIKNFIKIF